MSSERERAAAAGARPGSGTTQPGHRGSPGDFLSGAAARWPGRLAVNDAGGSWSYRELDQRADALAAGLARAGVLAGECVAVVLDNGAPLVAAVHGVPRTGGVLAPLSPRLTAFELAAALRALRPAALLADGATAALVRDAAEAAGTEGPVLDAASLGAAARAEGGLGQIPAGGAGAGSSRGGASGSAGPRWGDSADPVWAVLWTSGTAGRPRGVALTGANLAASAGGVRRRLELTGEDRWYLGISCAHVGGLALVTRAALLGAAVVTRGAFSATTFNALVDEGRVTHASLVPTMLVRALDAREDRAPPDSLRCVLVGGAHAPGVLVRRALAAGFPVALTYGLTEATSQVATAPPELVRARPGTVGPPLPGVEVRIDRAGEVLVRGPTVAARYVGTDEPLADPDGWLHTGDLGALDPGGELRVTGRRAERIVTGGVNVDPAEVEDVLRLHPGVEDAAVVGLPDPVWGEVLVAATVRRGGTDPGPDELDAHARAHLSAARVPRRVVFLRELPRNANGKVDRAALRRSLLAPSEREADVHEA